MVHTQEKMGQFVFQVQDFMESPLTLYTLEDTSKDLGAESSATVLCHSRS